MGAHQKIDRVARKQLGRLLPDENLFPTSRRILHFEGFKGPDAIKRKSPAKDEPWHYFNPFDETDAQLLELIQEHYQKLVTELKAGNEERSAFEAAWLAHAMVDGLTPAHHYPYEEKLTELRGGRGLESRTTFSEKLIMPGDTRREKLRNNWKMWGGKGLISTHLFFEFGIASLIAPLTFGEALITPRDLEQVHKHGLGTWYRNTAREVAVMDLYHAYIAKGWTPKLAYQIRHKLGPTLVKTVAVTWYSALVDAGLVQP